MQNKHYWIEIFEAIIIIVLLVLLLDSYISSHKSAQKSVKDGGLLSPRIYTGILKPQSLLITSFEPLKIGIKDFFEENNITASVYIENLRNGASMGIGQNKGYFPASLHKLPVAVLILQKVEHGTLNLTTKLPIYDSDRTQTSGTFYSVKKKESTVKVLLEEMIKQSDNTAFNVLYHHVDKAELAHLLEYYDIKINLDYPSEKIKLFNDTTTITPVSIYNLFSSLYLSTVLIPQDSEYILSLLTNTTFDINKLAHLPSNVTVAHKYGLYYDNGEEFFHDCGIMYIGEGRFFYCIMTKHLDGKNALATIGIIVNSIYTYIIEERTQLQSYKFK